MPAPKFDEQDRRKVIADIEDHFGVTLTRVGSRKKVLRDQNDNTYWVLGGYDDWHGIPLEMMEDQARQKADGRLVVAKRYKGRIDIYVGSLRPLVSKRSLLAHTTKGDYQFNIRIRGNHLFIKEIPDYSLQKLGSAEYSDTTKEADQRREELRVLVEKMSPEEMRALLLQLANERET